MRTRVEAPDGGLEVTLPALEEESGDALLGNLLRQIRQVLGLTEVGLARRLGTASWVITQLERGDLTEIGSWHEVSRIISDIAALAHVDDRSLLERAALQYSLHEIDQRHPLPRAPQQQHRLPKRDQNAVERPQVDRRKRRRLLFSLTSPVILVGAVVWGLQSHPSAFYKLSRKLPVALGQPLQWALDRAVLLNATHRDGLLWIDVDDPRVRKRDRLAIESPADEGPRRSGR